ncbi:dihydrolipoamide acetyltransferase family protein [Streptomyces sp. BE147]|uniref:dihydrolipoamide acetyltransferase family protein n=1 Tax=Streptomyces sp. BE147 TaxID=3002524 RepID=UPI002E77622B|nr:dihydrolipoamide acetyltransferase family protein [Streptomyces sp. BE147]MEE1741510.1 dihydrolipoamide acetyltransferase family protein [Streptomyces sp. BE147]
MPSTREFALPDLGEGLVEAEVVKWLVRTGDPVAVDQPVAEVETAKARVEVPCPYGGVVAELCVAEGATAEVGRPLIRVAVDETDPAGPAAAEESSGQVLVGYGTSGPARRRRTGAASAGRPPAPASPDVISPVVRRLARTHGVDLGGLSGSGPGGLILRHDVEAAIAADKDGKEGTGEKDGRDSGNERNEKDGRNGEGRASEPAGQPAERRTALRGVRAAAAEKFSRSRREIPHVTCWRDVDATGLLAAREQLATADGPRIGLLALLARICLAGLDRFPQFNSRVTPEGDAIVRFPEVHLGFAAQSSRGLMTPVVRGARRMPMETLAAELGRLTQAAREGRLTPAELTGGTFTLNNYGVFGADGATPILDHPQAAMLGIGRITPRPWIHRGEMTARDVVQLSFTFDHRVGDGAEAGAFLGFVAAHVERPALLLRHR